MAEDQEGPGAAGGLDTPAQETPAPVSAICAIVERWFVERIHNSPASRDTNVFNHLRQAVDDLKTRLTPDAA